MAGSRSGGRVLTLLRLLLVAALIVVAGAVIAWRPWVRHGTGAAAQPSITPTVSRSSGPTSGSTSSHPTPTRTPSLRRFGSQVLTPQGFWWGVDSTEAISDVTLRNVGDWYRGAHPQMWGRYLRGHYGVTRQELAYARAHHIFVYLIVGDRNCSQCGGADLCGNDRTADQARADAHDAIRRAGRLGLPAGLVLFKDIEQVSSCRGEPTRAYLLTWYRVVQATKYRTGFYGNVHRQYYDFPVGYCAAAGADPDFASDVVLAMNEDEPRIGAPSGSTGPHNAPPFTPQSPHCAPRSRTVIWQYGESLSDDNLTDIDEARPGTSGLLAPDGTAT